MEPMVCSTRPRKRKYYTVLLDNVHSFHPTHNVSLQNTQLLGRLPHLLADLHPLARLHEIGQLIEIQIPIRILRRRIHLVHVPHILLHRGQLPLDARHGRQFRAGQINVGPLPEPIREIPRGRRDHRASRFDSGLISHAERTSRHFRPRPGGAKGGIISLLGELRLVHFGRGCHPEFGGKRLPRGSIGEEFSRRAEVSDVGHAGSEEDFVDFVSGHFREEGRGVGIVGEGEDGFLDLVHVDFDDFGVLGSGVGFHEMGVGEPVFHAGDASFEGARVSVSLVDHPFEHDDVGTKVFDDGFLVEFDGASRGGSFGGGVGEFEGLFAFEVGESLYFEDASGEDVFLSLLFDGEESVLDGRVGNGLDEVAEGDAGLHRSLEPHQYALGHVEGEDSRGGGEGDETGSGGEGNAEGKARVGIASRAHGVGDEHPVQPRVNDAVSGPETDPSPRHDEIGQRVVRDDVHRFGIGGRVTETLHDEIGREAEAREGFEFVPRHGPRGILRSHRGHDGLAVLSRRNPVDAAGLPDHFLAQGVSGGFDAGGLFRHGEDVGDGGVEAQSRAGFGGEAPADDEGDAPPGADFVQQDIGLELELGHELVGEDVHHLPLLGVDVDDVPHVEVGHVHLDGQGPRVLHGVEEDGRDLAADAHAAGLDVGHVGDLAAHVVQDGIGGRLARRARPHHVSHVGQRVSLLQQLLDLRERPDLAVHVGLDALPGVLQHGQRVQRDVRAAPRVLRRGQVVRVGLARHLEHRRGDLVGDVGLAQEPLGVGPRFQHGVGRGPRFRRRLLVAVQFLHVVEGVEHQQRVLQLLRRARRQLAVLAAQQRDQGVDVVPPLHGPQQFHRAPPGDQRGGLLAQRHGREVRRLDVGGLVDAGGDAVAEQFDQALGRGGVGRAVARGFDLVDQLGGLGGVEGLGEDAPQFARGEGGAFGDVGVVGLEEGGLAGGGGGGIAGARGEAGDDAAAAGGRAIVIVKAKDGRPGGGGKGGGGRGAGGSKTTAGDARGSTFQGGMMAHDLSEHGAAGWYGAGGDKTRRIRST
mmetsp:Transcript_24495/g.47393  ORF Transcript_24495/g.47393 Transcript_24495/m.47393 type:complete len:1032 (+) Transcript_24495:111-3206(+)